MGQKNPRVDDYIAKSAEFAKPILIYLRELVHKACPDVEEKIKWSMPHFDYKGPLCHMASFKNHCAFGFWKGAMIFNKDTVQEEAMGQFGRIITLADLPEEKVLVGYIKEAVRLNEAGIKSSRKSEPKEKKILEIPDYFMEAMRNNKKALETFENFSPSHKKEYVEWITEAKSQETRKKRLETAIEWMAEGKARHWKYMKK